MGKVWGFNCFGMCIKLLPEEKIEEYNKNHPVVGEKIVSWKPYEWAYERYNKKKGDQ